MKEGKKKETGTKEIDMDHCQHCADILLDRILLKIAKRKASDQAFKAAAQARSYFSRS
jgi:Zn-finger nucleic acid-binding protein